MQDGHLLTPAIATAFTFLASAAIVVLLSRRLKLSSIVGFILAGLVVGPSGLPALLPWDGAAQMAVQNPASVMALAEIGVVFLMFSIGLELSPGRLWRMRNLVLGLGSAQILVSALIVGLTSLLWDHSLTAAVLIGLAFALSSTAVVMPLLIRSAQFMTPHGRATFGVLLAQDMAVVPILLLAGALGQSVGPSTSLGIGLIKGIGAVAGILVLGVAVRPLFRAATRTDQRELFLAMALLVIGIAAVATEAAGLKAPLGAFLAGLILADTEFRHQLDVEMEPLKGLLLGLFFFSVGLSMDLRLVITLLPNVLIGLPGLIAIKGAIAFILARAFGRTPAQAVRTAAGLAGAGEFVFVILGQAAKDELIPFQTMQYMQALAGLSLMLTPLMLSLGERLAKRMGDGSTAPPALDVDQAHPVLIAGFGRVGQTIATFLERFDIPYLAIDRHADLVRDQRGLGRQIVFGDATRPEMLRKLHLEDLKVAIITVDDATRATNILTAVRQLNPNIQTFVRAGHHGDVGRIKATGAYHVVPDTIESSMQLAKEVCGLFDIAPETVAPMIEKVRRSDYNLTRLKDDTKSSTA